MIELEIRMADDFSSEEIRRYTEEYRQMQVLENADDPTVSEEEFWNSKRKFTYRPMILPLDWCVPFSKYDAKHTVINYGEMSFIARIKYEEFRAIYESLTGEKIRYVSEFKIEKPTK